MPSETDRFDGDNCFIITNPSRTRFHLYGDDPNEIKIVDIAQAISKQVRFTGHLIGDAWYSCAEHCLLTSAIVAELGGSRKDQLAALMHDTPEAYLADIAAPFKREIGKYYEKEALVWKRIAAKYDIDETLPEIVKEADWLALFVEAHYCVATAEEMKTWIGYDKYGEKSKTLKSKLWLLAPAQARVAWLDAFLNLKGV